MTADQMNRHLVFFVFLWCHVCRARFSLTTAACLFLTEAELPFPVKVGR
ncbi:hypothetical protein [Exiguobacterium sp. s138]|nr:hypothetical protein [Exiguobacterium sp. s138]